MNFVKLEGISFLFGVFFLNLRLQDGFAVLPGLHFLPILIPGPAPVILSGAKDLAVVEDLCLYTADGFIQDGLLQLAFPDDDDAPAFGFELSPGLLVTLLVPSDFRRPEVGVSLGNRVVLAAFVAVPEAAVDEDDSVVFGEDDIGGAGETLVVHPVAEPQTP